MTSFNRPSGGSRILKGKADYMVWEASSGVQDQRSVGIKPPRKYVWGKVPQQLSSFASLSLISDVVSTVRHKIIFLISVYFLPIKRRIQSQWGMRLFLHPAIRMELWDVCDFWPRKVLRYYQLS